MPRLGFGAFLAPHHPIGENPTLQFRRDLKFVQHVDELRVRPVHARPTAGFRLRGQHEQRRVLAAQRP